MIDDPKITQTAAQRTAVIHLNIPRSQIQQVMGPAIGEVFATIGAQGIPPIGPVFSYHHGVDPERFDFEVGVPVASEIAGALPVIGDVALVFMRVGWNVTGETLSRFYALHIIALPIITVLMMAAHFIMIRRQGVAKPL